MLFSLIFNQIRNRFTRTFLTALGISVAIATIVFLGIVTEGFIGSLQNTLQTGGSDATILQADSISPILSSVKEKFVTEIEERPDVITTVPTLFSIVQTGEASFLLLNGIPADRVEAAGLTITAGRAFTSDKAKEIILGSVAALNFEMGVGDSLELFTEKYSIVGIYETGVSFQDSGVYLNLHQAQKVLDKEGEVSFVSIDIAPGADIDAFITETEEQYKNLAVIKEMGDFTKVGQGMDITRSFSLIIMLIAVIIGGIGIANTMLASVFERTREIGVLRALGWSAGKIVLLILGESFILGLIGLILGTAIGIGAVYGVMAIPTLGGYFEPAYTVRTFANAIIVAFAVSLIGGLFPALRATRLSPKEALRYE